MTWISLHISASLSLWGYIYIKICRGAVSVCVQSTKKRRRRFFVFFVLHFTLLRRSAAVWNLPHANSLQGCVLLPVALPSISIINAGTDSDKTAHGFLQLRSFVWYTPFLLSCFFIPDEGRWVSFHWAHRPSSGSNQGQQVFLQSIFEQTSFIICFLSLFMLICLMKKLP